MKLLLPVFLCFCATSSACWVHADQFTEHSLQVGGDARTYYLHKPNSVANSLPLVVVLHGGGGNGKGLRNTYGFKPMIERGEMIVVYPNASQGGWMPEDVRYLDKVIDEVLKTEKVNPKQLFITGASRGGVMTFIMVSKSNHLFAGAGTVIASSIEGINKQFPISQPINFAMIAGTDDPLMPYAGGWGAMRKPKASGEADAKVLPVEEMIATLVEANDLQGKPASSSLGNSDPNDGCTNEVLRWIDKRTNRQVMLVKVQGGGHVVPGGRQYLPASWIGRACKDFDHAEVMWKFFQEVGGIQSVESSAGKLEPQSEQALRKRNFQLFEALRSGDIEKCMELAEPDNVRKVGKDNAEKFFKVVSGLVRIARLKSEDRKIDSITPSDDGKTARVEVRVRSGNRWQPPSIEIWTLVDGTWYYRETVKN